MIKKLKSFLLTALIGGSFYSNAQINVQDSTAQAVAYWSKSDLQKYKVYYNKYKIKENDTISTEKTTYNVDIKVVGAEPDSYTMEWFYHDYNMETDNQLLKKINTIANDVTIRFKTDQFGAFKEVLNWKKVSKRIGKSVKALQKELKGLPQIKELFASLENSYKTKESIEGNAIKDILQYYAFHGSLFKLNEKLTGETLSLNNLGGEPFKTTIEVSLDEIDPTNDTYIIRMKNTIDSQQLTHETYQYLKNLKMFGDQLPKEEDFPVLTNETYTVSRIHGATGWVVYSMESKESVSDGVLQVEQRVIEIQ